MRKTAAALSIAAALGAFLILPSIAIAQSSSVGHKKVFGYQDAETGAFHPVERVIPDTATTPTFTGTIVITFQITLKTAFSKPPAVDCSVGVYADSVNVGTESSTVIDYDEEGASIGTASGSSATCVVTIHYSWVLPQSSGSTILDTVTANYSVGASSASSATGSAATTRSSSSDIFSLKQIPPTGTTTTRTVNVTL
jgi:hypothetical protein